LYQLINYTGNKYTIQINQFFGHRVLDPAEKAEDGTTQGILDRSYNGLKALFDWLNNNGVQWMNEYDLRYMENETRRINHAKNGDFNDELLGLTGEIWGYSTMTVDAGETLKVGKKVAKLANGAVVQRVLRYNRPGVKYLRFWLKGNVRIQGLNLRSYASTINTGGVWKYYEIPYWIGDNNLLLEVIYINALADSWFQKLEIDEK